MNTLLFLLLACNGDSKDDGSTEPITEPTGADTGADTGTGTVDLPRLEVEVSEKAPGVLLIGWPGEGEWHLEADGQRIEPEADGRATVMGYRQGSSIDLDLIVDGEYVRTRTVAIPTEPEPWVLTVSDPARSAVANGVVVVGIVDQDAYDAKVMVLDGETGGLMWWHTPGPEWEFSAVERSVDQRGFVWGQYDSTRQSTLAQVVKMSLDGREYHSFDTPTGHHIALEIEQDRYAWFELDVRENTTTEFGNYDLASDRIIEANVDGSGRTELLNVFDELFEGVNDYPCSHIVTSDGLFGYDDLIEWTHGNSLVYVPSSDSYMIHLRWIDTVVKLSRSGEVTWMLSGPWSDFTQPDGRSLWNNQDASVLFSHGHFTDAWDDGLLMYDNGKHSDMSRVVEVALDEIAMTAEIVWSIPAPDGQIHSVLGDARRLPNGNVLISWTVMGLIQEVTREGDVVWELRGDPGLWFSRLLYAESLDTLAGR